MNKAILVISLTPVASEPRVIRQVDRLIKEGFDVTVAGFKGKDSIDPRWKFIALPQYRRFTHFAYASQSGPPGFFKRLFARFQDIVRFDQTLQFLPFLAEFCYWSHPLYRHLFDGFQGQKFSLIMCHDYFTLPLGCRLLAEGGELFVDVHEHAVTQHKSQNFLKNLRWFFWHKRYVHALQKKYLPKTRLLTTVCDGIAKEIEKDYPKAPKPIVMRSVPFYVEQPLRRVEPECLKILYHGSIGPRGVKELIETAAYCRRNIAVTVRGSGDSGYVDFLKKRADQLGVSHKISFEVPVPFSEIIPAANSYDIGFYVPPGHSLENQFSLPNKFFEYIMAGLALCVADLPEMAKIVKQYDLGLLVPHDSQDIARRLDALTPEQINGYKKKSLLAAKDLCWERESEKLVHAIKGVA